MIDTDEDNLNYLEIKEKIRGDLTGLTLIELAQLFKNRLSRKQELEDQLKDVNAWCDVLRFEAIPARVEHDGLQSPVKLTGIGRISITQDLMVSIKGGLSHALIEWFNDNGLGDIVRQTVHPSTLKAFVKQRLVDGNTYPDDFINVTPIERASLLK